MNRKITKQNKFACVLSYNGKTRKCFAKDWDNLRVRVSMAIRREWYLGANLVLDELNQISQNEWHGRIISVCGKPILCKIYDREDRVKEAARLLGAIGGSSGTGKKKVRGDSNYYRVLRYKGIEKQRTKDAKPGSK
jgi:hypothetical protein